MLVPAAAPPMAPTQTYYTKNLSVSEEMVKRYYNEHTMYATDNAAFYYFLDTALIGTKYHATIASFKSRRDGRVAYLSLKAHFCGPDL